LSECKHSWAYSLNFSLLFSAGTCLQTLWLAITRKYQLHLSKICMAEFSDINFLVQYLHMSKLKSTFDINNNLFWTLIVPTVAWIRVWEALVVLIKVSWNAIYLVKIAIFNIVYQLILSSPHSSLNWKYWIDILPFLFWWIWIL